MADCDYFEVSDVMLQKGGMLPNVRLAIARSAA